MRPLIVPKPAHGSDPPKVLVALDVDGVLNRVDPAGADAVPVTDGEGNTWPIRANREVLEKLDAQLRRPGVAFGWLTSWDAAGIRNLVEQAFGGLLAGGYQIGARPTGVYVSWGWKTRDLFDYLDDLNRPPYIWVDDVEIDAVAWERPGFADGTGRGGGERLLIAPEPSVGLQPEAVDAIRQFIDKHAEK